MLGKLIGVRPEAGLLILRIAIGIIFFFHGIGKFEDGLDQVSRFFASVDIPYPLFMAAFVASVEMVFGAAMIVGYHVRIASLFLCAVGVVAIIKVKIGLGLIADPGKGAGAELDLILLAANLSILMQGAGQYSVDALLFGGKKPAAA